jgi:hypothetical protein
LHISAVETKGDLSKQFAYGGFFVQYMNNFKETVWKGINNAGGQLFLKVNSLSYPKNSIPFT